MFRRKPTRIELKVEDLQEYESLKKEIELKSSSVCKDTELNESTDITKKQSVNERIGFDPQPRVSMLLPSLKMAKVLTLYDICLNKTVEFLKETYWNLNYDDIENPFQALPSSLIDELIVHVTRHSVVDPLKSSDLHLLLTSGRVRNFKLEDVSVNSEDLEYILMDLSSACSNLLSVKIKNVFCSLTYRMNLKTYALEGLLSHAPKLESVESCIEFNLSVLSYCMNLRNLVLHFPVENKLFEFLEIDGHMVPHNSLRVLEVYEDIRHPISYIEIAVILMHCNELVEINCDISKSLEYLHTEALFNGTLATKYKLQKCCLGSIYLDAEDATVSRDGVYIASLTCPDLREVDALVRDNSAIYALSDFNHLTSLLIQWESMSGGNFYEGILPLLRDKEFGHKLKSLHIMHFYNIDFPSIGETCPNLEELKVEFISETNSSPFIDTSFRNLTNLHVENICEEDCQARSLIGLLVNASNLKYLTIQSAGTLNDSVLAEILQKNSLAKVKQLRISNCALSVTGLQNLAQSLTALEYFEMSSSSISLDFVASVIHEINPQVILSATVNDI